MIYEERRIRLHRGNFHDYRAWALETLWPQLTDAGHRPLCILNGLIGAGVEDVVCYTGFKDFDAWQAAQPILASADYSGVRQRTVRSVEPSGLYPAIAELRSGDRLDTRVDFLVDVGIEHGR